METMTKGRVYVTVGGDELLQVIYFDTKNKRTKTIDLSHPHFGEKPHVHHGYFHNENDSVKGFAKKNAWLQKSQICGIIIKASDSLRQGEHGISVVPVTNPGACVGAEMRPFL